MTRACYTRREPAPHTMDRYVSNLGVTFEIGRSRGAQVIPRARCYTPSSRATRACTRRQILIIRSNNPSKPSSDAPFSTAAGVRPLWRIQIGDRSETVDQKIDTTRGDILYPPFSRGIASPPAADARFPDYPRARGAAPDRSRARILPSRWLISPYLVQTRSTWSRTVGRGPRHFLPTLPTLFRNVPRDRFISRACTLRLSSHLVPSHRPSLLSLPSLPPYGLSINGPDGAVHR